MKTERDTQTIRCSCGRRLAWRPNANGLTLCPTCGSAHVYGEFSPPVPRQEIEHDFSRD